ncbi:MAG TPA: magnesium transporter [Erysipelotrichaceae bacterium]|nr:magnesium transporter [Erysipelotrichaceae bacterium]
MEEIIEVNVELLTSWIKHKEYKNIRHFFEDTNTVDAALLVDQLAIEDLLHLFKILRKDVGADVLSYLSSDTIEHLTTNLNPEQIQSLMEELYSDDLNEILSELPDELVTKVLQAATPELRKQINEFLSYEDSSCGSIMSVDFVTLKNSSTVAQAMRAIRRQGKLAETINWCYVVDEQKKLIGSISLKDILFAKDEVIIEDIMEHDIHYVYTHDDQEEAARLISKYDITSIPVIDSSKTVLGIITVDDIFDVVEEEATEDIHKMGAMTPLEGSYVESSTMSIIMSRLPWLLVLMISATFTGSIISSNQELLVLLPSLAIFIPMLMDTAGNAGSQASAMVIRGLVVDDMGLKDFVMILVKETQVSFLLGIALFVINTLRIGLFMPQVGWGIAIMVSLTIFITILLANLVGGALPLLALVIKQDPASMAAPLITTLVDALSLTTYFLIASYFLRL